MRALTVRQPWAWAIVHGGKTVENRSRNIAGDYRGPVAIHAGLADDVGALQNEALVVELEEARYPKDFRRWLSQVDHGAIIGVANLWAVHQARPGCCPNRGALPFGDRWAMADHWHLCLSGARALPEPVPYRGRLGLWNLPDGVLPEEPWAKHRATHPPVIEGAPS